MTSFIRTVTLNIKIAFILCYLCYYVISIMLHHFVLYHFVLFCVFFYEYDHNDDNEDHIVRYS